MRNASKSPKILYSAMVRKWKSDLESGTGPPPKVNNFS